MKRLWIWLGAGLVVVAAVVAIRADTRAWHGWHGHMGPWGPGWYVAHELNLTDAQKKQIGTIWARERPRIAGIVRELATQNAALRQAHEEKNDGRVQDIASQQGAIIAQLLMEKERVITEIYASVLNADQRKRADELQNRFDEHLKGLAERLEQGGKHEE